jgi:hypothetical protein
MISRRLNNRASIENVPGSEAQDRNRDGCRERGRESGIEQAWIGNRAAHCDCASNGASERSHVTEPERNSALRVGRSFPHP